MKLKHPMLLRSISAAIVCAALSACGESDLIALQEQQLDDARIAAANPDLGSANPGGGDDGGTGGSDGGDDSGGTDGGDEGGSDGGSNPNGIDLSTYDLVFADEFDGSAIDSSKWNTALSWGPDLAIFEQLQYYVDTQNAPGFGYNPFSFNGEHLTISAIETPENLRSAANEQAWLSGVLTTAEKFEFTYGYAEIRVNLEPGRGVWPSFWMLSSEFVDLKPELFIMEYNGANEDSVYHNYNYEDSDGNLRSPGQWEVISSGLSDGFHTVGVQWSPEELLFFIDGEARYRVVGENVSSQNMYLILNLAIGGVWPGAPDGTTTQPANVIVDYVRVHQLRQ